MSALKAIKQMHKLLYRQGKTLEDARRAIAECPSVDLPQAAGDVGVDGRLPRRLGAQALPAESGGRFEWHPRPASHGGGRASGDLLAGLLLDGLQARWPDLQAVGIGGPSDGPPGL
jgi:hypothetical protein